MHSVPVALENNSMFPVSIEYGKRILDIIGLEFSPLKVIIGLRLNLAKSILPSE
jgi:hypothetical protein